MLKQRIKSCVLRFHAGRCLYKYFRKKRTLFWYFLLEHGYINNAQLQKLLDSKHVEYQDVLRLTNKFYTSYSHAQKTRFAEMLRNYERNNSNTSSTAREQRTPE
jgi:hypothetical protein